MKSYTVALAVALALIPSPSGLRAAEATTRIMQYRSQSPEKATLWQKELRSKLFELLKMSDLVGRQTPIPFSAKTISTTPKDRYVIQEFEINTTPTRRMRLVLTVPANRTGPLPAIVLIAGHGGTLQTCYQDARGYHRVGEVLAKSGYVTASIEVSRHKVYEEGRTLMGERLWDLMRCIDFLESRPEVDIRRLGCAGQSLGGEMTMWLCAMDLRVRAAVVAGFLTDMNQMEKNHCMCWKFPGLRELVDYADIYSLIAPRPLLCQNGLEEPASQFPPSKAIDVLKEIGTIYADYAVPQNVTIVVHKGGHELHVPSVVSFFKQHLDDQPPAVQPRTPPPASVPPTGHPETKHGPSQG